MNVFDWLLLEQNTHKDKILWIKLYIKNIYQLIYVVKKHDFVIDYSKTVKGLGPVTVVFK